MTDSTWWTMIREAASGDGAARSEFARRYLPAVGAYLGARWRGTPFSGEVDDATQEVFLECYRDGGALARVDPARPGGFRAYLMGIARNVARRVETRRARRPEGKADVPLREPEADDDPPSKAFERAWAREVMREAADRQRARAAALDEAALRRVELLRLRFQEDLPIREIAARWGMEAARVHHEYAKAREEFRKALSEVVAVQLPGSPEEVAAECARLVASLA